MRKTAYLLLTCLCLVFLGGFGYFKVLKTPLDPLVSPVLGVSKIKYSDNIWFPEEASKSGYPGAPEVTAQEALFVDANSGEVLYQKNSHTKAPIASLTKIMTVILALESKSPADTFTISQTAADLEPDKMYLKPGEKLKLEELLDGIFLISANDAAEAIAENVAGTKMDFVNLMNTKAKILGMNDTEFINPTGLEEDQPGTDPEQGIRIPHNSTAYDVLLMSRFLVHRFPDIVKISSNPHIYLDQTDTHQAYDLTSGINLLTTYPGVLGLKTGYTPEAGLTLVTLAQRGDRQVMGVLLGATERREDAKALLDYSFQKLGIEPPKLTIY